MRDWSDDARRADFPRTLYRCHGCNRFRQEPLGILDRSDMDRHRCYVCRSGDRRNDLQIFFEEFTGVVEYGCG